ncbi:2-amino-4-oxopentanoate thiolase subunit OrtA [Fusibacter sp. 3D3]|uniref:2-amino-4-oxopentanoate thiolase subunit OrtA n=1 Tax=Fusibacter sp. 3D3 TaxID=1048380 RepID=UPI000853A2A0|nr:2-amino-4-oxopentanoate thiolase subunit OrtA [Fusibacter sp. 3D3]GAU76925.1 2-amino-4-ketopentanoate thiolase, alpha subunit [Fusibacter sp. 3D3]
MQIKKGDWVKVHRIILTCEQRAPQVPEDTKKVPLEMWVKGFAQSDSELGEEVTVKTITGRLETGKIVEVNPTYSHSFGNFIPELLQIGIDLKDILFGGDADER